MNIIITGVCGTVAPHFINHYQKLGHNVMNWDLQGLRVNDESKIKRFITDCEADLILHLSLAPTEISELLAKISFENNIKFLYTSSVSVWSDFVKYPVTIGTPVCGTSEYARYKYESEQRILSANKNSYVARIGWQIGYGTGSTDMVNYLCKEMQEKGVIKASHTWFPACSFMRDTASAICEILENQPSGLYLVDSNNGLSFYDIATELSRIYTYWNISDKSDFVMDNRMIDERVKIRKFIGEMGCSCSYEYNQFR